MAKIYGINGIVTGKVSNVVYAVRNGVQIARQYQPVVNDRKTEAQVEVRAKFKLLSQMATVMAPVIAIPRQGTVSTRNLFMKANYDASAFSENKASINLNAVKITSSVVSLPSLVVDRGQQGITVNLNVDSRAAITRMVYAMFSIQLDNTLRYVTSRVVTEAGDDGRFQTVFGVIGNSVVIYGYGIRDNTEAARVVFGNLEVPNATTVAQLIVTRRLTEADVTLTETKAAINNPTTQQASETTRKKKGEDE